MDIVKGNMGWIEVIVGPMFSGKSEELIRRLKRAEIARQRVQIFRRPTARSIDCMCTAEIGPFTSVSVLIWRVRRMRFRSREIGVFRGSLI